MFRHVDPPSDLSADDNGQQQTGSEKHSTADHLMLLA